MKISRTKIVGWLIVAIAVCTMIVDALNGGGFDLTQHINAVVVALGGAGFVFLRSAVDKIK